MGSGRLRISAGMVSEDELLIPLQFDLIICIIIKLYLKENLEIN